MDNVQGKAIKSLRGVLCNPDGEVVIGGSDGDRKIISDALEALAAPSAGVEIEVPGLLGMSDLLRTYGVETRSLADQAIAEAAFKAGVAAGKRAMGTSTPPQVEYDRGLIVRMLHDPDGHGERSRLKQADLLEAADNRDAAGVHTAKAAPGDAETVVWQYRHKQKGGWGIASDEIVEKIRTRFSDEYELRPLYTRPAPPVVDTFDMLAHLRRQREWSERTFGPGPRTQGVVDHIRKELNEILADPADISEWIDVVILALDGAWRAGALPQAIIDAIVAKQSKNEGRTWPDWRTADPNKAIEHDRSTDKVKCDRWSCDGGKVVGPYDNSMTCGKCEGTGLIDTAALGKGDAS